MKDSTIKVNLELADADVRKMLVRPGDVVVISIRDLHLTQQRASEILREASEVWPDNKVVILPPGVELSIVTPKNDDGDLIETAY